MTTTARNFAAALFFGLVGSGTTDAHAAGTLISGDGSMVGAPVGETDIVDARAILFQQGSEVTAVIQAATFDSRAIGSAWILPIHGTILAPPAAASPTVIDDLVGATDPFFEAPPPLEDDGCGGGCEGPESGCTGGDSGAGIVSPDYSLYDSNEAGATWTHYGPEAVNAATESLRGSGFDISDDLAERLSTHGASGGSVVVMFFTDRTGGHTSPALIVRYAADSLVMPQALTPLSAASRVQTTVFTLTGNGATGPVGVPHATPRLGKPLYAVEKAPDFYAARALVALEDAGPTSWLLEYSNTLESLYYRIIRIEGDSGRMDSPDEPWIGLNVLVNAGLLDAFNADQVWITRWRTLQSSAHLTDQVFAPDASVPRYQVFLEGSLFQMGGFWPVGLLLGTWVLGRRVRREDTTT